MALALAVAGCGGRGPAYVPAASAPAAAPAHLAVAADGGFGQGPRHDDRKPHEWQGRAPWHYPVHGIDVSRWQGEVDWSAVRGAGVAFVWIKATEGGDHADPMYAAHSAGARRAGIPHGAYHYYHFCRSAEENARWFIRNVPRERGALPPVLDIEWTPRSRSCPGRPPPAQILAEARRFLSILTRHYGTRPVIYTTVDFYRDTGIGEIGDHEFWLRSVAGHPSEVYPGQRWTFWQYTGTGIMPGVTGDTDINAFGGSRIDWPAWLAARAQPG